MPGDGQPRWSELLRDGRASSSGVVAGGIAIHALNTFIVTTILPTVVADIGGLEYLAWNTTLYVAASLLGAACCSRLLARFGPRALYRAALATFALGTAMSALAPGMAVLLAGRLVQGLGAGVPAAAAAGVDKLSAAGAG